MRGFVLLLLFLGVTVVRGQEHMQDVVYLKNGSIIRGNIIEILPEKTVKIQTADSSLFVYSMVEVDKITKEKALTETHYRPQVTTPQTESPQQSDARRKATSLEPEDEQHRFAILGAVSLPVGDLGSTSGLQAGYAETGFALGADGNFPIARNFGWMGTAVFTANGTDLKSQFAGTGLSINSTSWTGFWLLSGIRASGYAAPQFELYLHGQVGFLVGSTPELRLSYASASASQPSATSAGFAYGVGAGMNVNHIHAGVRFISSEPEYQIQAQGTGGTAIGKFKQPTSLVLVTFGIAF